MTHYDEKALEAATYAAFDAIGKSKGGRFMVGIGELEIAAKAALAAYHSQREEAGMVEVPREPTLKMRETGGDFLYDLGYKPQGDGNYSSAVELFKAMLQAAQGGKGGEG